MSPKDDIIKESRHWLAYVVALRQRFVSNVPMNGHKGGYMAFSKKSRRWRLVGIGLLLAVCALFLVPTALRYARGTSRFDQAIQRLKAQRDMTPFDQKMKGLPLKEAKKQQMAMATQGLFRLSDAQLTRRLELVNKLLGLATPETKRDFATGRNPGSLLRFVTGYSLKKSRIGPGLLSMPSSRKPPIPAQDLGGQRRGQRGHDGHS